MAIIEARGIEKSYGELKVLKGLDLTIEAKEVVSIVGASGAGKTTLLQILGTLDRPDQGVLKIGDTDVFALNDKRLSRFRNQRIGFIFSFINYYQNSPLSKMSVFQPLSLGNRERRLRKERPNFSPFLKLIIERNTNLVS